VGLFQSAQGLLASVLALARTRLELLGTELQETLARLVLLVICAVAAVLLCALALGFAAVALVMAAPPEQRIAVSAGLALAFLAAAGVFAWRLRREAAARPFAASLAELERDAAALPPREPRD
jgi:uncharacterized membrane protein YqjE